MIRPFAGRSAPRWIEWALLGLLALLFLVLGSRRIGEPGLAYPEANDPVFGMELALDFPRGSTDWQVKAADRTWPLRIPHPYDFSVFDVYWSALAFKAGGVGVGVLRFSALLLSAATLALSCVLCRLWLGRWAAFAAGLLLAVNPAFLIRSRFSYWAIELQLALPALAALTLLSVWHKTRRPWALFLGAFAWGFTTCVTTKAIAFIASFPLLYWALAPRKDFPSRWQAAAAAACAALGASDFIAFNAARGMPIFRYLLGAMRAPTAGGVDNFALLHNLRIRLGQLVGALNGFAPTIDVGGASARDWLFAACFFAGWAALAWRCLFGRPFKGRGFVILLLCLPPLLLLETAFTPWSLDAQHVMVLWPYVALVVAAALDWLREATDARFPGKGALAFAALLLLLAASALRVDAEYFSRLEATGGVGAWSGAITGAAEYMDLHGVRRPFSLDQFATLPMPILTAGRVDVVQISDLADCGGIPASRLPRYESLAADGRARFFSRSPGVLTGLPGCVTLGQFRALVEKGGRRLVAEREFPPRPAAPVYTLWKIR